MIDEAKAKLGNVSHWTRLPNDEEIQDLAENLKDRNFNVIVVENKEQALEQLKKQIPDGSEVMTGSSTTLHEIGFMDFLFSGEHKWKNLVADIVNEQDMMKQAELRRKAVLAEYFLSSVNAVTKEGELVAAGLTGSRTGAYPFAAKNLVLVLGTHKLVRDVPEAMKRVKEYVFPLEDARAKEAYGMNSGIGKWVILEREPLNPNRVTVILVKEILGF